VSERAPPRGRNAYAHVTTITTRWADNDAYGHVNNTVYYAWFDTAVNEWLIAHGLLDLATGDPIALVVETGCRYFAPLEYPGEVELLMGIERLGASSVTYRLGVFSPGKAAPAAEGHFTHVVVDRATRRPVPIPERWRTAFVALMPSGDSRPPVR
jgi:acyl-CoA thioester hydrolase